MRQWYVSYGSNLNAERFRSYLVGSDHTSPFGVHPPAADPSPPIDERWLWIDHALYFAGVSRRWTGSSAFVSCATNAACPSVARAYLVEEGQFAHLAATENGVDRLDLPDDTAAGSWTRLELPALTEAHRGKYDALLRLPDIDGIPAFTLTSSFVREPGAPSDRYLQVIRTGLAESPLELDIESYLDAAAARPPGNSDQAVP